MSLLSFNSLVCWQITLALLHVSWIGLVIGMIVALANAVLRNSVRELCRTAESESQRCFPPLAALIV